MQSAAVSRPNA
jgi:hypothetical protein